MVMSDKIVLKINGVEFNKGWDEARVHTNMDSLSISFEFTATQKRPFVPSEWPIQMGAACTIEIAGQLVTTGYIEEINIDYNKDSHVVQIAGRDKLADVADSASDGSQLAYQNSSGASIIRKLVAPFGISVTIDPSVQKALNTAVSPIGLQGGDGIFDVVMKLIKISGAVGIALPDGNLLITSAGTLKATDKLVLGSNILRGALKQSDRERFQYYFIKGYDYAVNTTAPKTQSYFNKFQDKGIKRFRALGLTMETYGDIQSHSSRAKWEAKFRAGKSREYGYSVQGWTQKSTGKLWDINMLVAVEDELFGLPSPGLDGTLLINAIEFVQSNSQGSISSLKLCSPEKWKAQAELDKVKAMSDIQFQTPSKNKTGTPQTPGK